MSAAEAAEQEPVANVGFRVPDGPWNADVWLIERGPEYPVSGEITCAVATCDRNAGHVDGEEVREYDILCAGHRRRFVCAKPRPSIAEFVAQQATARTLDQHTGGIPKRPHYPPIDFTRAPPELANELRYIAAIKTKRMIWTNARYVSITLRAAIDLAGKYGFRSLRDFPVPPKDMKTGSERLAATFPNERGAGVRQVALSIRSMLTLLDEATPDPWDADAWHAADMDLSGRNTVVAEAKIYWSRVTCTWLRQGLKSLARAQLQSGSRAWGTVKVYSRGGTAFSRYLDEEAGHIEPSDMSRAVFLDFVAWMRDQGSTPKDLHAVNSLARLLTDLKREGIVPDLPETIFLSRGENAIPKVHSPKPFPPDILAAIDKLIADESALPRTERLILRLCRAVGPRISEALMLPCDSVTYIDGRGYKLEYFQTKIDEWRKVPLPPKLGRDLVIQKQWVAATYGPSCNWMFPYAGQRPRQNTIVNPEAIGPWPFDRFRLVLWKVYQEHGIVESALSGETLTGVQMHRFRHSIATGLLNEGWTQYEVQSFMGHRTPTMMQAYAEINEDALRKKYLEYMEGSVDFDGHKIDTDDNAAIDVERMRDRFKRSTLPNGFCTLPEKQKCDFLPSPCLSCTFFRTTRTFLPIHIRQRDDAVRELDLAREDGRHRAAETHERTIIQLNKIIDGLDQAPRSETPDDH